MYIPKSLPYMIHSSSSGHRRPQHGVTDPSAPTILRSRHRQRLFRPVWLLLSGLERSRALKGDPGQAEHEGLRRIQVPGDFTGIQLPRAHTTPQPQRLCPTGRPWGGSIEGSPSAATRRCFRRWRRRLSSAPAATGCPSIWPRDRP